VLQTGTTRSRQGVPGSADTAALDAAIEAELARIQVEYTPGEFEYFLEGVLKEMRGQL
jgi:hypothetical protein